MAMSLKTTVGICGAGHARESLGRGHGPPHKMALPMGELYEKCKS